jgi:uncharacterized protein (TIGR00369 family)
MSGSAEHFRRLERMYLSAPNNDYYRPDVDIAEGRATIRIAIRPEFFHAAGSVHGSIYFKAMDDAAFFAANSLVEDVFVLTTGFNLHLLRPVNGGTLTATGEVVSATRNLLIADATLTDDDDRTVGRGTGSFMRSRMKLNEIASYADEF